MSARWRAIILSYGPLAELGDINEAGCCGRGQALEVHRKHLEDPGPTAKDISIHREE
jgi:hypothetical protein